MKKAIEVSEYLISQKVVFYNEFYLRTEALSSLEEKMVSKFGTPSKKKMYSENNNSMAPKLIKILVEDKPSWLYNLSKLYLVLKSFKRCCN